MQAVGRPDAGPKHARVILDGERAASSEQAKPHPPLLPRAPAPPDLRPRERERSGDGDGWAPRLREGGGGGGGSLPAPRQEVWRPARPPPLLLPLLVSCDYVSLFTFHSGRRSSAWMTCCWISLRMARTCAKLRLPSLSMAPRGGMFQMRKIRRRPRRMRFAKYLRIVIKRYYFPLFISFHCYRSPSPAFDFTVWVLQAKGLDARDDVPPWGQQIFGCQV